MEYCSFLTVIVFFFLFCVNEESQFYLVNIFFTRCLMLIDFISTSSASYSAHGRRCNLVTFVPKLSQRSCKILLSLHNLDPT